MVLKLQDRSLGSDYINASFIDVSESPDIDFIAFIKSLQGYNKINAYIACQGPIESTITEFWRMVWEQHVSTIVNLGETGKVRIINKISPICIYKVMTVYVINSHI